ncbi:cytochrome b [Geminicoccaceae bacterium 1502E]|nr:cytochrome b [Geminicoccaceae bacterium 1502E]
MRRAPVALRNSAEEWGAVAKALHWLLAALLAGQWALGFYMSGLAETDLMLRFELYQLHKSAGLTLLLLVLLRLAWRAGGPVPGWPQGMPRWERRAASASHALLYVLMIGLPVTGFLMVSTSPLGLPTRFWGLFAVPHPLGPNATLERAFANIHENLAWAFAFLVLLHVAAALKHHFRDRDRVLVRMLPARFFR